MKKLSTKRKEKYYTILLDDKYFSEVVKYNWHIDAWGYARSNYCEPNKGLVGAVFLHSFVWFLETGKVVSNNKKFSIDHINRNPLDNQLSNLRLADISTQMLNRKSSNKTGYRGVTYRPKKKTKPYQAFICQDKKSKSLGYYHTAEEAFEVYSLAYKNIHGVLPKR